MKQDRYRFTNEEVPEGLYERVMAGVMHARTRAARMRIAITSLSFSVSSIGLIIAVRETLLAARASGFTTLANLAITDTSTITLHARSFALSLVETLPSLEVSTTLFLLSVLLISVRTLVRSITQLPATPQTMPSV